MNPFEQSLYGYARYKKNTDSSQHYTWSIYTGSSIEITINSNSFYRQTIKKNDSFNHLHFKDESSILNPIF